MLNYEMLSIDHKNNHGKGKNTQKEEIKKMNRIKIRNLIKIKKEVHLKNLNKAKNPRRILLLNLKFNK